MGTRATSHLSFLVSYRRDYYLFDYLFKGASLFSSPSTLRTGIPPEGGGGAGERGSGGRGLSGGGERRLADNARGRFKRCNLGDAAMSESQRTRRTRRDNYEGEGEGA
jgi:hypothetical protein